MTSLPRCAVWTIPYPFEACPCLRRFGFAFAVFPECRSCPIPAALLSHRRSLSCDRSWHTDEERISHSDGHSVVDFRILMSLTSYFRAKKQALHISKGSTTSHSFRKACAIRFDMQGLNCVKLFAVGSALYSRKHFPFREISQFSIFVFNLVHLALCSRSNHQRNYPLSINVVNEPNQLVSPHQQVNPNQLNRTIILHCGRFYRQDRKR